MDFIDIDARLRAFATESDLGKKASLYTSLRSFEDGFDRAQGLLRTIASAWLLVSLAALATVIANDASCLAELAPAAGGGEAAAPGQPAQGCSYPFGALARSLILLAAALGITALWYLDQRVYQSLLHSVFALGVKLEQTDDALPAVRWVMQALNGDITSRLSWYYQAPFLVILAFQLVNLGIYAILLHGPVRRRFGEAAADWELFLLIIISLGASILQGIILGFAWQWPSLARHSGELDALRRPSVADKQQQPSP